MVRDRAIASALAQTYSKIEIVIVGDHCDAATEAAVRSIRDPRIQFENLAERGRYPTDPHYRWMVAGSTPMNRALDLAEGDWVAPLDDDDEFVPDHIDVLLDACRTRDLELAYGVAEMEVEPGVWETRGSARYARARSSMPRSYSGGRWVSFGTMSRHGACMSRVTGMCGTECATPESGSALWTMS